MPRHGNLLIRFHAKILPSLIFRFHRDRPGLLLQVCFSFFDALAQLQLAWSGTVMNEWLDLTLQHSLQVERGALRRDIVEVAKPSR